MAETTPTVDGHADRVRRHVHEIVAAGAALDGGGDAGAAGQVLLALEEDLQADVGADVIRGIIHHGEHPLPDAILAGEIAQTARPIGVLHVGVDQEGVGPHVAFAAVVVNVAGPGLAGRRWPDRSRRCGC